MKNTLLRSAPLFAILALAFSNISLLWQLQAAERREDKWKAQAHYVLDSLEKLNLEFKKVNEEWDKHVKKFH